MNTPQLNEAPRISAAQLKEKIKAWRAELDKVISGYGHIKDQVLCAILARGHVLLRAVPGTAKTTLANTLKKTINGARQARFQMTPDMKPSDILGVVVFNVKTGEFEIKQGPMVDAHITLYDEINRTTPKTLSATLQALQEGEVTIAERTFRLPELAFAIATMNPVEQEGTFPLPEAALDRFCYLLDMRYVSRADEIKMAKNVKVHGRNQMQDVVPAVTVEEVLQMREMVEQIAARASDDAIKYIVDLTRATRPDDEQFDKLHGVEAKALREKIALGASPRCIIWTLHTAAAHAFMDGRDHITPDDVKAVFRDVTRHRILLTQVAEFEGYTSDKVIDAVLSRVPVVEPRPTK